MEKFSNCALRQSNFSAYRVLCASCCIKLIPKSSGFQKQTFESPQISEISLSKSSGKSLFIETCIVYTSFQAIFSGLSIFQIKTFTLLQLARFSHILWKTSKNIACNLQSLPPAATIFFKSDYV